MTKLVRVSSVVLAGLLVVGGGVWVTRHRGIAPVAGATSLGPFRVGEEVRNRAQLKMTMDLGKGAVPQEIDLSGQWTATVTDVHDGLVEVACQLSGLKASVRDGNTASADGHAPGQEDAERQLAGELMRRFFVTYRGDGAAVGAWLPKGMNPSISSLLLRLAGAVQLVRATGDQAAWVVQERDINGEYTAVYQKTGPNQFRKQKSRYVRGAEGGAGTSLPIAVERSTYDFRADAGGRVLDVAQDEVLAIEVAGTALSFKVALKLALRDGKAGRAPELAGAFAREREGLERQLLEQLVVDPVAETARRDRNLLAGASLDELKTALDNLKGSGEAHVERSKAIEARLEALFRLDPAATGRVPEMLRKTSPEHAAILINALSMAGTPEAQAALASVAEDAGTAVGLRRSAIQYLGLQKAPSEKAVAALGRRLDDADPQVRHSALLAYGTTARALRPAAPNRSGPIAGELHRRLARATSESEKGDVIAALGNAGDPASLPVLRPLVEGNAPGLRSRAIRALRFIGDPAVDPLLGTLLTNKSNENVRLAAIGAIRYRDVGPFAATLAELAKADPVEEVRQGAIDLLGSRLRELPALRTVLEHAREKDPKPRLRELAARYLGASNG